MKMPFLNDEILQDQHTSISYFMLTFINDTFDRVDGFHKVLGHDTLIHYVILLTLPEVPPNDARTPPPHTLVAWLALTNKTKMHREPVFEITSYTSSIFDARHQWWEARVVYFLFMNYKTILVFSQMLLILSIQLIGAWN